MESVDIRELTAADGDRVRTFWLACGIRIRPGDDDASLDVFARKNPGLALLAEDRGRIIGTALAGWDGRRAWLYHVAVHPDERRRGIGRTLVRMLEEKLTALGCQKINLIVWQGEERALAFWSGIGYVREDTVEFGKQLRAPTRESS